MSDLISRSEVWKAFISRVDSICDLGDVREILDSIPTAEPKVEKWIIETESNGWNEWYVFTCPVCGARIKDNIGYHEWKFNYCPNCGAKMRENRCF